MEIKAKLDGLEKFKDLVDASIYQKAMKRTIKDEGRRFKTTAVKQVRKTYNIKSARLKKVMSINVSGSSWRMKIKSRSLGLYNFSAKQTKKGVSFMVKKGNRKKLKNAFIARDVNGNMRVFERKTKKRLPLKSLYSLSPTQMFNKEVLELCQKKFEAYYAQTFEKNLNFYMKK